MNTLSYKTISANNQTVEKSWLLIDADGQKLGRLATEVANLLRGKHKTNFTPHVDCGDHVIVVNSSKVELSGKKWDNKEYITHSGYPGGQKFTTARQKFNKNPNFLIEDAIRGMLPKNRLGREIFRNLFVYEGPEHKQEAQKPEKYDLNKK